MTIETDELQQLEYSGPVTDLQSLERSDDLIVAPHVLAHTCAQAVLTETDTSQMSATFKILTRGKEPNRANRFVQIAPGPNGGGLLLDEYQLNPVVLFDHGFTGLTLPIGTSQKPGSSDVSIKLQKSVALATCYFSKGEHAAPIYALVAEGILRGCSAGFRIQKAMMVQVKRANDMPAGVESWQSDQAIDVVESRLFEWSITAIGADAGAVRQVLERGKVQGERLPSYVVQSLSPYAEKPKVIVQGTTFRRTLAQPAVTIEGDEAAVQSAIALIERPQVVQSMQLTAVSVPRTEPLVLLDPNAIAASVAQSLAVPATVNGIDATMEAVRQSLGELLNPLTSQVTPLAQQVADLGTRLDTMTGVVR